MAVFDILPSTNLSGNDIRDTLASGGGSVNNHASSWFKPEAKINQYAYYKPVRSATEVKSTITDKDYHDSLGITKYTVGNPIPVSLVYSYNSPYPSHPLRMGDFRGYMKNEYPELCDLSSIPSVWDFDNYNERIPIGLGNSSKDLMSIIVRGTNQTLSTRYYNSIIIIATKGSDKKYFLLTGLFRTENKFLAYIPSTPEVIAYFRQIGIQDYTCEAIGVIIPEAHPLYGSPFKIMTTLDNIPEFIVHPEVISGGKVYSPVRKNFKITKPADRVFWSYQIVDDGNGRDTYVPRDAIFGAQLYVNSSLGQADELKLVNETGEFSSWNDLSGDFIREQKHLSISGTCYFDYYNFGSAQFPQIVKPVITSSPAATITDTGSDVRLSWNNVPITAFSSFEVRVSYLDPNYRPDGL